MRWLMITFNSNIAQASLSGINSNYSKSTQFIFTSRQNNSQLDQSNILALRDRYLTMIDTQAKTEEDAQMLLHALSKPNNGGLMLGGLPELSNSDMMARHDRISAKFNIEQQTVEQEKNKLINKGLAAGKRAKSIVDDIVGLYDAQSELFKTGIGWNGQVFAFNESSTSGYQRALAFSRDVVDVIV